MRTGEFARRYGIVLIFLTLCFLISAVCQYKVVSGQWPANFFLTADNFLLILYQVSVNGILAIGMTLVVVSGGIDLSVGSVLAFAGMLAASFATGSEQVTGWSGDRMERCLPRGSPGGGGIRRGRGVRRAERLGGGALPDPAVYRHAGYAVGGARLHDGAHRR